MQYRVDIQIMRGVAVFLVVLFHLNTPYFNNGFLGVDVFFVISGFLMALLYKSRETKKFYQRRASRLLPAYFFVVIATLIASVFITLPSEHNQVVEQGFFASLFASNIGFWMQNSYFNKTEFNPLLHLWSLGVEIQFYLIVPLLAYLHTKSRFVLPVVFFASLLGCLALVLISPNAAFFMMPFRIWQFLLGAWAAYRFTDNGAIIAKRPMFGLLAFLVILAVVAFYPVEGQVTDLVYGHPSLAALVVTLSMTVLLACGFPKWLEAGFIGYVFHKLGNWSYSIYLVHFPVIVLFLYQPFSGTVLSASNLLQIVSILLLIALLSAFTYIVFEKKIRFKAKRMVSVLALSVAVMLVSWSSWHLNGLKFNEHEKNIFLALEDRAVYRCGSLIRVIAPQAKTCELTEGLPFDAPKILLIGDSHADSIKMAFASTAKEHGYRVFLTVSNGPVVGQPTTEQLLVIAKNLGIGHAVFHFSPSNMKVLNLPSLKNSLRENNIRFAWLLQVPIFKQSVPKMIWEQHVEGGDLAFLPVNRFAMQHDKTSLTQLDVKTFDVFPYFCEESCTLADSTMKPFYFDSHHLTLSGAERLMPLFDEIINWFAHNNAS